MGKVRRWEIIDNSANRRRWYELEFVISEEQFLVIRRWGRMGCRGRGKTDIFTDRTSAEKLMESLARKRERHGYQPVQLYWQQLALLPYG